MQQEEIKLKWVGLGAFKKMLQDQDTMNKKPRNNIDPHASNYWWRPGIYMHILKIGDTEYLDYVGKVVQDRLIERQIEHYRNLCGGICFIRKNVIKKFDVHNAWNKEIDWECGIKHKAGKYENPRESVYLESIFDKNIYLNLAPIFFNYANSIEIYVVDYSEIVDQKERNEKIEATEKILIREYNPLRNSDRRTGRNEKYKLIHDGVLTEERIKNLKENNRALLENE